jgi:pyruvate dehydrogenase E2 component (dihydrolipoamide acetyltransferase)
MPLTLTMPKLSPTMTAGTVAKWHKKEGDQISAGDLLLEISTDKATVEHNALDAGWLRKILVQEGIEVEVNQPLAVLTETKEESIEGYTPEAIGESRPVPVPAAPAEPTTRKSQKAAPSKSPVSHPIETAQERTPASPLARKLAKEKGIDLSTIQGSGPGQRVMSRDLEQSQSASIQPKKAQMEAGTYVEEALSPVRKVIARRLQEAKASIPHFYVRQTVDVDALVATRNQLDAAGIKLSFNDFILRATALALSEHPEVNCGFNPVNHTVIKYQTIDIAVAVSIPGGLITPIVHQCDDKSLVEISSVVIALAKRAKEGKLQPHEYQGGSFTVSNLGMYAIDDFIAVINPPQAAILAVGGIREVPVVKNGQVVPGRVMVLTLSADHRVVDGVLAAQFIRKINHYLEHPALLLI